MRTEIAFSNSRGNDLHFDLRPNIDVELGLIDDSRQEVVCENQDKDVWWRRNKTWYEREIMVPCIMKIAEEVSSPFEEEVCEPEQ